MPDPWSLWPEPPRRWQLEAFPLAMKSARSRQWGIVQACTGAGKSRLIAAVVWSICQTLQPGWRVVVTVPSVNLVEQTAATLEDVMPGTVGVWYTDAKRDGQAIVCCLDSLGSLNDHIEAQGLRVAHWLSDEAHRGSTDDIVAEIKRMAPVTRLGVTATPWRSNSEEAVVGFDRLVYQYTIEDATRDGVLVPLVVAPPPSDPDEEDPTEATIQLINDHAPPGPGIVSARTISDATSCAERLTEAGIPAEPIHSKLTKTERGDAIERLRTGEIRCLVHVALLVEGIDLPWLRWLVMRRNRQASIGIVQELGRILRTMRKPDRWGEKTHAVVMLPYPTPLLDAISSDPALSADPVEAAKHLRDAMDAEADDEPAVPMDCVLPPVEAVGDVGAYFDGILAAMREAGVTMAKTVDPGGWRYTMPSMRQIEGLRRREDDKRKSGLRYLPGEHRKAIRMCLNRPEVMNRGIVSDCMLIMDSLRSHGGKVYGETGDFWEGLRVELPEPPIGSCYKVAGKKQRKKKGRAA